MSKGLFFEKRGGTSKEGRFFRDLPGRVGADFHKSAMFDTGGMPSPDMGAGEGLEAPKVKKLLDYEKKEHGHVPTVAEEKAEKKASPDPTFLYDEPVSDGLHRPARTQPEALEDGGTRFQSSEADYGTGRGFHHGTNETGTMRMNVREGSQMGKQASVLPRFLGTTFEKSAFKLTKADLEETGKEVGGHVADAASKVRDVAAEYAPKAGRAIKDVAERGYEGAKELAGTSMDTLKEEANKVPGQLSDLAKSPAGAAGLLAAGGLGAYAGGKKILGGAAGLLRRKPKPAAGLLERIGLGLKHLVGHK